MVGHRSSAARKKPVAPSPPPWSGRLVCELTLASRTDPFSAPGWLFELKYDGFRLLAAKDGKTVTLRLRTGRDATARFLEVVDALAALPARTALLDGELVVFGREGRSDFDGLRARAFAGKVRSGLAVTACLFESSRWTAATYGSSRSPSASAS